MAKLISKIIFLFSILLILVSFSPILADGFSSLGGVYKVDGKNPNGTKYTGKVTITNSGDSYLFVWIISDKTFEGTGTISGDTLTVNWGEPDPVIYKIKNDGKLLFGNWGPNGAGKEVLKK
ncbi:MAG: fibronectin-binding protein [Leptospiraceae bacterium]|nr:fibronectin-binding protein [Leptospiraceae bacterium]